MTDSPIDLDAIQARAEASTPGPWTARAAYPHLVIQEEDNVVSTNLAGRPSADAEFIAHAREDVPALLGVVAAIREIHRPTAARGLSVLTCADCGQRYPCPTVRVLDRPLGSFGVSAREAAKGEAA